MFLAKAQSVQRKEEEDIKEQLEIAAQKKIEDAK